MRELDSPCPVCRVEELELIERLKARIELSAGCCYGDMPDCSDEMNAAIKEIERLTADLNESERQTRAQLKRVLQRDERITKLEARVDELESQQDTINSIAVHAQAQKIEELKARVDALGQSNERMYSVLTGIANAKSGANRYQMIAAAKSCLAVAGTTICKDCGVMGRGVHHCEALEGEGNG